MTYFTTCNGCAIDRAACQRLGTIKKAILGHYVTSLKFKCLDRVDAFTPGQRVETLLRYSSTEGEFADYVSGTVIKNMGLRVLICVDAESRDVMTSQTGYGKFRAETTRPIEEPARDVCAVCKSIGPEMDGCHGWSGDRGDAWVPKGCVKLGGVN